MSSEKPTNGPARSMLYDPTEHRIRSFVTRAGRLSTGQARAFEDFGDKFLVEYKKEPLDLAQAFGRQAPVILEIGFGMGDTTAVGSLLKQIGEQDIQNLRLIQHDVFEVLNHMIGDATLAGVHVFFPDPWHKARHNKRRLIQPAFVKLLCQKIAPGGYLHLATDWEDYAVQMLEVLSAEPELTNTADGYAPQPAYRPLTKFENRGIKLGHGVWDLVFTRK